MPLLNPNLRDFWQTPAPLKKLKGGRGSSKTWDAAGMAVLLASRYKLTFLCLRQFQNRISDSVYAVLISTIERFGLEHEFRVLANGIYHKRTGSRFHFYGMNRHVAEIKGFEGADVCWIEEGEGLTKAQWSIIDPTIRNEGAQCWILYNPRFTSDFIETIKHDPANGVIVRHINYDENPFLSDTMLRKIAYLKEHDYEEYEHIYLGIARSDDDRVIIKASWIEAAIDAHLKLGIQVSGARRLGFDVADSGNDLNSVVVNHGILQTYAESWKGGEDELLLSSTRAFNIAVTHGASIRYDSIGVGAGCGPKFGELNRARELQSLPKIDYMKFVAGGGVINPEGLYIDSGDQPIVNQEYFANAKAQAWWLLADRFRHTYNAVVRGHEYNEGELIAIDSKIPLLGKIESQLATPFRDFDKAGKVKVESKDDLAKRNVPSPNEADAFVMANAPKEINHMSELMKMAYS